MSIVAAQLVGTPLSTKQRIMPTLMMWSSRMLAGFVLIRLPSLSLRPLTLTLRMSLSLRLIFDFAVVPPMQIELSEPQSPKLAGRPFLQKPGPVLQSGGTGASVPEIFWPALAGAAAATAMASARVATVIR